MTDTLRLAQRLQIIGPWVWSDCTREQAVTQIADAYIEIHKRMEKIKEAITEFHHPACGALGSERQGGGEDENGKCISANILALTKGPK